MCIIQFGPICLICYHYKQYESKLLRNHRVVSLMEVMRSSILTLFHIDIMQFGLRVMHLQQRLRELLVPTEILVSVGK